MDDACAYYVGMRVAWSYEGKAYRGMVENADALGFIIKQKEDRVFLPHAAGIMLIILEGGGHK